MLSALLRRERMLVLAALFAVILLAWSYLLLGAGIEMEQMDMGGGQMMLMAPAWTASYAALIFLMWAIMMMAMMLPSAAPAVLLAAALMRQRDGDRIFGPTGLFVLGYLLIWFGFSLAATALQWGLDRAGSTRTWLPRQRTQCSRARANCCPAEFARTTNGSDLPRQYKRPQRGTAGGKTGKPMRSGKPGG
jgi:predicted metal-binding membrane protein